MTTKQSLTSAKTKKSRETKDTFIKSIERLSGEDRLTHNSMAKALGLTIGSWEYKVKKFGIKWRDYNIYNMRIDSVASSSALSSSPLVLLPTTLSTSSSVSLPTTESVASSSDEEAIEKVRALVKKILQKKHKQPGGPYNKNKKARKAKVRLYNTK